MCCVLVVFTLFCLYFVYKGLLVQFEKLQSLTRNMSNKALKLIIDDVIEGFDEALRNEFKENLFLTRTVDEIVWGYSDPFLKFLGDLNLPISAIPKDGKFSLEVSVNS